MFKVVKNFPMTVLIISLLIGLSQTAFANQDSCSKDGQSQLIQYMIRSQATEVESLLKSCPSLLWMSTDTGQNVVMLSVVFANDDTAKAVLKVFREKIDHPTIAHNIIFAPDQNGLNALELAVMLNSERKLSMLLEVMCPDKKCMPAKGFKNPINLAVINKNGDLVARFIEYGFPIKAFSIYDNEPSRLARRLGHIDILKILKPDASLPPNRSFSQLVDDRYGYGSSGSF